MFSDQLFTDVMNVNKSRTSRYFYLLHIDLIIAHSQAGKGIETFQFYEKISVEESFRRIVLLLCTGDLEDNKIVSHNFDV